MAFCILNGYQVPVAEGAAGYDVEEIGHQTRAFDGSLLTDRRAQKRKWKVTTAPMTVTNAEIMKLAIEGNGFGTSFENGTANLSNGVAPETNTGQLLVSPVAGSTPAKINDDAKIGRYGYTSTATFFNQLTANQATGGDASANTVGFLALGGSASIAYAQENAYQGAGSIKTTVTSVNSGHGVTIATGIVIASLGRVQASVRVLLHPTMADNRKIRARLVGSVTGAGAYASVTASTTRWTTIKFEHSTLVTVDVITMEITDNETSGGTMIWYVDGCFAESSTDVGDPNGYLETWRTAGTTTGGFLRYIDTSMTSSFSGKATINLWARQNSAIARAEAQYFLDWVKSPGGLDQISLYMTTTPGRIGVDIKGIGSTQSLGDTDAGVMGWEMLTVVWDATLSTNNLKLYRNGSFAAQITVTTDNFPLLPSLDRLAIGCRQDGARRLGSPIDNFALLPYVADTTQIANWFSLQTPMVSLPRVSLQGDIVTESSIEVYARITDVQKMSARSSGTFYNNLRKATIEIMEA